MSFKRQVVMAGMLFAITRVLFYMTVVPSESMVPTLLVNDYVVYSKTDSVEIGDVILFQLDGAPELYTKRVIAKGKSVIDIAESAVYVDGVPENNPEASTQQGYGLGTYILNEDELFVMGDNRPNSADSRAFGPISQDNVRGKLFVRIPLGLLFERR